MKNIRLAQFGAGLLLANMVSTLVAAPFGAGNLVVVREGTGSAALTNAATAVFLDEYTPTGTLVQSLALPTTTTLPNAALTHPGNGTSGGELTLSTNGQYLVMGGYAAAPGVATVPHTVASTTNRVIARIDMSGNIDTTTWMNDAYSGQSSTNGDFRGAVTTNGTGFWTSGNSPDNPGIRYVPYGNNGPSTQLNGTSNTNNRWITIFGGDLYFTTGGSVIGVSKITGLPTTANQTVTELFTQTSPYGLAFASATRMFVADETALTASGQGLFQWDFNGSSWTNTATYSSGLASSAIVTGVRGVFYGTYLNNPTIFVTEGTSTNGSPGNRILRIDGTSPGSFTAIATAGTNTAFRGIVQVPGSAAVHDWTLY